MMRKRTYHPGLFGTLKKASSKHKVRLAPDLNNKIENFYPAIKQKEADILGKRGLIYRLDCSGSVPYFRETRKVEHLWAVGHVSNGTGLDMRIREAEHSIHWNAPEVFECQSGWIEWRLEQGLGILATKGVTIWDELDQKHGMSLSMHLMTEEVFRNTLPDRKNATLRRCEHSAMQIIEGVHTYKLCKWLHLQASHMNGRQDISRQPAYKAISQDVTTARSELFCCNHAWWTNKGCQCH